MPKLISVIILVCMVGLIFTGCSSSSGGLSGLSGDNNYTIRVSGTAGLEFSGSYMAVTSDGKSTSKSVDGVVPTEYSISGTIVSVAFQKQIESGTLKVEILRGGEMVNSSDTTAAYGVVSVATN